MYDQFLQMRKSRLFHFFWIFIENSLATRLYLKVSMRLVNGCTMRKLLKKFFNKKRRTNTDLKEKINYLIETDRKDSASDV